MSTFVACGVSGTNYHFEAYPIYSKFKAIPGLYIFTYCDEGNIWRTVYIGETRSFMKRIYLKLQEHHALTCALANGATHIAICTDPKLNNKQARLDAETDLRNSYQTSCNEQ